MLYLNPLTLRGILKKKVAIYTPTENIPTSILGTIFSALEIDISLISLVSISTVKVG